MVKDCAHFQSLLEKFVEISANLKLKTIDNGSWLIKLKELEKNLL